MSFLDLFSDKADLYASARPRYPQSLFNFVRDIAPGKERVWDCGTGNGQAAVDLIKYFSTVWATDPSREQIKNAVPCRGVTYSVQTAEETDFPNDFFDAICVAQALHWFNHSRFYMEAKRVLKQGGVVVAWGYSWFTLDPKFDSVFDKVILQVVHKYWAPQNAFVWNEYKDIPFPFSRIPAPRFEISALWTFPQFFSYIHTWSAVRRCLSQEGPEFFKSAESALIPLWGDPEQPREVKIPLCVLAGKN